MNLAEEINLLMDQLHPKGSRAWGNVVINCDGKTCQVSDPQEITLYEMPTLIEALRLAMEQEEAT